MTSIFRHRKIVIITVSTALVAFLIAFITIWLLYMNAKRDLFNRLSDIVNHEKINIKIWANEYQKQEKELTDHLRLFRDYGGIVGRQGEIAVARQVNDSIEFFISGREEIYRIPDNISLATPMQKALDNESGYMTGKDYEGVKVFAAYTYIEELDWGVVAKIPVSEINKPYIISIVIVFFLTTMLVILLTYILIRISNPILDELLTNEKKLIEAKHNAEKSEQIVKKQKDEIEFHYVRLESLLKISQNTTTSIQEFLDYALEEAIKLTDSKIGYIYFYNEQTKQFIINTWSREVMHECTVQDPQTVYDLDKTGCWGEAVRQRKPIIINDYEAENQLKKGIPEGHVGLKTFLTIPIIVNNSIVAVAGVANKANGYNHYDALQLSLLMDSVWKITLRINMENDLRETNKKLTELNATKDKLFSIISHDLKSPFSALLALTESLLEDQQAQPDGERREGYFSGIYNVTKSTLALLENLLTWARSQTGNLNSNPSDINLKELMPDIMNLMDAAARNKKISLINTIERDIWVWADLQMLNTILRNLISNAIKFTRQNGAITVSASSNNGSAEICVSDTGVGMHSNVLDSLFSIGENNSSLGTDNERGTGLGLILCKDFVEKQGGQIRAESEPGKGSRFYFTIPLHNRESGVHSLH